MAYEIRHNYISFWQDDITVKKMKHLIDKNRRTLWEGRILFEQDKTFNEQNKLNYCNVPYYYLKTISLLPYSVSYNI